MNFLELCQRVRQECGVAGSGPTAVTSQVNVMARIVDWTRRAWIDIQSKYPFWKFLRNQETKVLVIDQREYSLKTDWGLDTVDKFDRENFYIYDVSAEDETKLTFKPYGEFRRMFRTFSPGRPSIYTELPGGSIAFDRIPDAAYTITFDYWMTPEKMTENDDIPSLPEHFHDVIVWKATMMFAGNETATEVFQYAKSQFDPLYARLFVDQADPPGTRENFPLNRTF